MIAPVLEKNGPPLTPYFPKGVWYSYNASYDRIISNGSNFPVSARFDEIPLFIRGGYLMAKQDPAQTTTKSRLNKIELLLAADENGTASGVFYWDDGDSLSNIFRLKVFESILTFFVDSYEEKRYSLIEASLDLSEATVTTTALFWGSENPPNLGTVTILGINYFVARVLVNGVDEVYSDGENVSTNFFHSD